ncbi:hypothetical protein [Leisingera caerulea]|nr:hypothetical protein [Leisingera caerulea]
MGERVSSNLVRGKSRWIRAQQPLSHNTFSAAKLISTIRETGRLKTAL